MITDHATHRARRRAGITDPFKLYCLWFVARKASPQEVAGFGGMCVEPDVTYRLLVWRYHVWLLARSSVTGAFITMVRKA